MIFKRNSSEKSEEKNRIFRHDINGKIDLIQSDIHSIMKILSDSDKVVIENQFDAKILEQLCESIQKATTFIKDKSNKI